MKENVKVSISGVSFVLTPEAYEIMNTYLNRLEKGYSKNPDGKEIIADIEARIAELILGHQSENAVVDEVLANDIILQMGYPDDMDTSSEPSIDSIPRRLYRNPEGAKLGGVCSGAGQFFNIDPVWLRLMIFAPLLLALLTSVTFMHMMPNFFTTLFVVIVMLYFILWIVVPMARTPRQKLEMRGEKITANSIQNSFSQDAAAMSSPNSQRSASVWADLFYAVGRVIMFVIKAFVFLIALSIGIAVLGLVIGLIALLCGGLAVAGVSTAFAGMVGISPAGFALLAILSVLLFLVGVGYMLIRLVFGLPARHTAFSAMWIVWGIITVFLMIMTIRNLDFFRHDFDDKIELYFEDMDDYYGDENDIWIFGHRYHHSSNDNDWDDDFITIEAGDNLAEPVDTTAIDTLYCGTGSSAGAIPVAIDKNTVMMVIPPDTAGMK